MSSKPTEFLAASKSSKGNILEFEGCNFLRCRLVLATLSGKSVKIRNIRGRQENPGLKEFEASFIRLMDKMTNGSKVEVSETGTTLFYQPGLLTGGKIEHDCSLERGIGYFLEPLMSLAPFCKNPVHAVLRGVTNNQTDPSPDLLKSSGLPIFKR
jgi:RNA 3'-terminal phosphate cyclase-like protein